MIPAGTLRKALTPREGNAEVKTLFSMREVSPRETPMGHSSGHWDSDWIHDVYTHDHTKPARLRTEQILAGRLGQHGLIGSNGEPAITRANTSCGAYVVLYVLVVQASRFRGWPPQSL